MKPLTPKSPDRPTHFLGRATLIYMTTHWAPKLEEAAF